MYIYADGCYFEWMRINNKRNERTEARKGRRIFSLFLFFLLFLSTSNNRYCLHIREKFTRMTRGLLSEMISRQREAISKLL